MQRPLKASGNDMRGIDEMFATHDARIGALGDRIGGIEKKMDRIEDVLQNISTAMAANTASQQAKSPISFGAVLSYARDIGVLMTLVAGGIVYVVQASTGRQTAVMEYRVDEMQRAIQHGGLQGGMGPVK